MRISCFTVDDFILNLKSASVRNGVVYVNRIAEPLNGSKKDATSFDVVFQASAVINEEDIIDCGEYCGVDRYAADGDAEGTSRLELLYDLLCQFCQDNGLTVRPGVISE